MPERVDEAVLDYYELEGRRTLEAGGRRLPLDTEGGDPARLVLSVRS
jgi:hypothetical protein